MPVLIPGRTSDRPSVRHAVRVWRPPLPRNDRSTSATSGATATITARPATTAATSTRSPRRRARRRRASGRRARARLCRRCSRADHATATPTAMSCSTASVAAAPMSPICVACRHTSTSSVAVPASPSTRITPNDVNVNTKTIDAAARIAGRSSGSVTSRNARHGDAPSVAAAASRSRREVVPHRADGAHDDGEVEDHVGQQDRPDAALPAVGQQGEHGGAHHDGRQHEHRGEQGVEHVAARRTRSGR